MTTATTAVRNVSVIATGSGSLHPEHMYGTNKPALWWVARSKEWIRVLIGDLSYSEELLARNQVAGTGDKATLLESFALVQSMKAHTPDLVIVASHDTTAADKLAAANKATLTTT